MYCYSCSYTITFCCTYTRSYANANKCSSSPSVQCTHEDDD